MPLKEDHRRYMELAIEEMKKSRREHSEKIDPKVGAVIIGSDGRLIDKSHRAHLRNGEHAEYTLIERVCRSENLENCTLYVTLEPCTTRNAPKIPCVKRIISARISRVFIGVLDPNKKIQGNGYWELLKNQIEVNFFDNDLTIEIINENKDYIRYFQNKSDQHKDIKEFSGPSEVENTIVESASLSDLSEETIEEFLIILEKDIKIPSLELWDLFYKYGFVNKSIKDESFTPTFAGILLFGKKPEEIIVQSIVSIDINDGINTSLKDFGGPLLTLPRRIEEYLLKNIKQIEIYDGFKRKKDTEYPLIALREAIINALVHRDYKAGARVSVQIYPNEVVIKSPGLLLPPLEINTIRSGKAPPYSRNPRIANSYKLMNWMEERGTGISKIFNSLSERGMSSPKFSYESGYFVVTFFQQDREAMKNHSKELMSELIPRQRKAIKFIQSRGWITSAEYAKKYHIEISTARRDIKLFLKLHLIEKKGSGARTYYTIVH